MKIKYEKDFLKGKMGQVVEVKCYEARVLIAIGAASAVVDAHVDDIEGGKGSEGSEGPFSEGGEGSDSNELDESLGGE